MSGSTGTRRPPIGGFDEDLELRIADWLQDGPTAAPSESVAAVLEAVGQRPRRHTGLERLRRAVFGVPAGDSLEIRRPGPRGHWLAAVASLALAVGLLMAFGAVRLPPPVGTPGPSPNPSPSASGRPSSPRPTPTPWPSLADLPVSLTGVPGSVCAEQDPGASSLVGTTRVTTGIKLRCSDHSSDPRLTGIAYRTYTIAIEAGGTQHQYGTATMTNQGGTWNGIFTILQPAGSRVGSNVTYWLGSEGYAGLQARMWLLMTEEEIVVDRPGILERVGPVRSGGSVACQASAGPAPRPGADGDVTFACAIAAEDPRLSGLRTVVLRLSARPDGTWTAAGSVRIENDAGAWAGEVTGVLGADGRYHLDEVHLVGSGLYSGFEYDGTLTGLAGELASDGAVQPAP